MNEFIRLPSDRLRTIYDEAQGRRGLPAQSLEKDLWVCWTLRELFQLPVWSERLTFKGGTSLSKAWKLIERFSEDIDLVIDREFLGYGGAALSGNQQRKLKVECSRRIHEEMKPALTERFRALLPAGAEWSLEAATDEEDRDRQTLLFRYPSVFGVPSPYLRPVVKIEMGARGQPEPAAPAPILPYVAEAIPELIKDAAFAVRTVEARRTFWEKVLLLHEETYRPAPAGGAVRKAGLARHYYDVWRLIDSGVAAQALGDPGLFEQVVEHRQVFFSYSWMDYATMRRGALRLLPLDHQLDVWRQDYDAMRAEMFFGPTVEFDAVLGSVGAFARQFNEAGAAPST
jgi:hypothetical protein